LVASGLFKEALGMEQSTAKPTLWQAIAAATQQLPFSQAKMEEVFSVALSERDRRHDISFLAGGGAVLADGCVIDKVDLRIGNGPTSFPGFLVLDVSGPCITLAQVRSHYSDLLITGAPRGHSLDEATWHSAMLPWGKLSFGFAERNRACLARIAFDPTAPQGS
jgi:hypothetical protein